MARTSTEYPAHLSPTRIGRGVYGTRPPASHCTGLYNIGDNSPVERMRMIEVLEEALGKRAGREFLPMQPGDIPATYADVDGLAGIVWFESDMSIEVGGEVMR